MALAHVQVFGSGSVPAQGEGYFVQKGSVAAKIHFLGKEISL